MATTSTPAQPQSIVIDGLEYVPVGTTRTITGRKLVRSGQAGVFFGSIISQDGDSVVMEDARRIWYWDGAASLSQLAMSGTSKPKTCKFPEAVSRVEIFGVCEILDVTEAAAATIDSVKPWTA